MTIGELKFFTKSDTQVVYNHETLVCMIKYKEGLEEFVKLLNLKSKYRHAMTHELRIVKNYIENFEKQFITS